MKRRKPTRRRQARRQRGVWSTVRADLRRSTRGLAEQTKQGLLWLGLIVCIIIFLAGR